MQEEEKKNPVGRPRKFSGNTYAYAGVRIPIEWKDTDKMIEFKQRIKDIVKEMTTPTDKKF